MHRRRLFRGVRAVSPVLALVAALLVVVTPSAAKAGTVQTNLNYVALGDSYSSGEGIPGFMPGTDGNGDFCHRSAAAYPVTLASVFLTAPLKFYACSGATTVDMQNVYQTEPPQITDPGVGPSANLITLTVGGDDAGFSPVLQTCIQQTLTAGVENGVLGPIGQWLGMSADPSCADSASFTSSADQQVRSVLTPVENLYKQLQSETDAHNSNDTSIIAADYPLLFPTTQAEQTCLQLSPILTPADQNWMNNEGNVLDTTLMSAASAAGVNMVDVRSLFAGHGVCGNSGSWLNGLSVSSGSGSGSFPVVGSFHPNNDGQNGYATAFEDYISNPMNITTPEGLPANPAPVAAPAAKPAAAATAPADSVTHLAVTPVGVTFPGCEGTLRAGQRVRVTGSGFAPSASVTVYTTSPGQASVEQQVGSVAADSSGAVDTVVTIPVGASGFAGSGTNGNLIGIDAIGYGTDGTSHHDALTMARLASRRSICGGATPLAGGQAHTLAVNADGTVSAWGNNSAGQLGNGTLTNSAAPVTVNGLSGVSAVTAGDTSSYALTSSGTVYAWGDNYAGQLGNGTTNTSTIPVQVSGLSDIDQIAAGNDHVLALKSDGTVAAWGLNNAGELGTGTTTSSATPVTVPGLSHVVQVAAGGLPRTAGHSAALEADGTVWTWGYGKHGQLGQGSNSTSPVPTQVPGLTGVVQIAASGDNTYALKSDGTVYAWGDDEYGQIGNPSAANNQNTPMQAGISDATSLSAGATAAAVIKSDGTVWDWGDNNTLQLGDEGACGKTCVTPVQAIGLTSTAVIAGGYVHSLAETTDGTIWAWGGNSAGQLGDGTTLVPLDPETVTGITAEH